MHSINTGKLIERSSCASHMSASRSRRYGVDGELRSHTTSTRIQLYTNQEKAKTPLEVCLLRIVDIRNSDAALSYWHHWAEASPWSILRRGRWYARPAPALFWLFAQQPTGGSRGIQLLARTCNHFVSAFGVCKSFFKHVWPSQY